MSSFYSIEFYNPFLILLIGLITFFGLTGFGLVLLKFFRIVLESPWRQVASVLLGILTESLIVQAVSMAAIASKAMLTGIWLMIVLIGLIGFIRGEVWKKKIIFPVLRGWAILPFCLLLIALITNLLAAIAPSSKIDELYYHMTVPSRIVTDGALRFYLVPWEGAVLPHMLFQIALAPLHGMGYPDAGNIVSWGLSLMLVWFGWRLATTEHALNGWSYIALACLVTGIYPVIWNVTNGSYAMGDLATAAAVVALISYKDLITKTGVNTYALLTSFLVLCSGSSKITMLPSGLAILLLMFFFIFRNNAFSRNSRWIVILYALAPWIILYLPMLTWTFLHSGSPFGPIFPGFLKSFSVYNPDIIRSIQQMDRQINMPSLYTITKNTLLYFSPLLWLGVLLFLSGKRIPVSVRLTCLILIVLQTMVLCFFIIFDPRFYGGLPQGILLIWIIAGEKSDWDQLGWVKNRVILGSLVFLAPWLGLQVFYASRFFPVALGFQDKMAFYHQNIAFMTDYLALNKVLPKDAVLMVRGCNSVRMNINFAPRPVFMPMDEPPEGKRRYLFSINQDKPMAVSGYKIDSLVYQNDSAVSITFRNPFRQSITGKLSVCSLVPVTNPVKSK